MDQRRFLRLAKRELRVSYRTLAVEIGVSPRTIEKWSLGPGTPDHRAMPLIATKFISRLLEERKRQRVLAGDRGTAEAVDAIVSHVDAERFREVMQTFDTLQRSAGTFVRMSVVASKPRYFKSLPDKNAWGREEELIHARSARQARASAR